MGDRDLTGLAISGIACREVESFISDPPLHLGKLMQGLAQCRSLASQPRELRLHPSSL